MDKKEDKLWASDSLGAYIMASEDIIADQDTWDDADPAKSIDFTSHPYWIVTDSGDGPFGYDSLSAARGANDEQINPAN